MSKHRLLGLGAALALGISSPVNAQTFNFGTTSGTTTLRTQTAGSITANVTGYSFAAAPNTLNGANLYTGAFTGNQTLSYSSAGVGVCTEGGNATAASTSGECPQADTNGSPNEGLLLSFTGASSVNLLGAVLNIVDTDDTLGIYGVAASGLLTFLGFSDSAIYNGGTGFTGTYTAGTNGGTYAMTFSPQLSGFSNYFFTSNRDSADGYRLASTTISAVPELEVWAMLIFGFGLIGFQMRRRSGLVSVTA